MRLKWITYCCPVLQRVVHLARLAFQVNRITADPPNEVSLAISGQEEGRGGGRRVFTPSVPKEYLRIERISILQREDNFFKENFDDSWNHQMEISW